MATFRRNFGGFCGFSLIELCVVIAILAVLSSIGTPWLLAMKTKSSIRADARDLHSTFREAQSVAVKRGDISCVEITSPTTYRIRIADYFDTASQNWKIEDGESTDLQIETLRSGNLINLATLDYFSCYNFRGLPLPGDNGYFHVTNNNNSLEMRITLTPAGHVKSEAVAWK